MTQEASLSWVWVHILSRTEVSSFLDEYVWIVSRREAQRLVAYPTIRGGWDQVSYPKSLPRCRDKSAGVTDSSVALVRGGS